jgi:hypothetical protein
MLQDAVPDILALSTFLPPLAPALVEHPQERLKKEIRRRT